MIYSTLPSLLLLLSLQDRHIMQLEGLVVPSYVPSSFEIMDNDCLFMDCFSSLNTTRVLFSGM